MARNNSKSQTEELLIVSDEQVTDQPIVNEYKPDTTPDLIVVYDDLINARVKVQDAEGNLYYLDPLRRSGEFTLRVLPKPVKTEATELPDGWRKPTAAEVKAKENKIDWEPPKPESSEG